MVKTVYKCLLSVKLAVLHLHIAINVKGFVQLILNQTFPPTSPTSLCCLHNSLPKSCFFYRLPTCQCLYLPFSTVAPSIGFCPTPHPHQIKKTAHFFPIPPVISILYTSLLFFLISAFLCLFPCHFLRSMIHGSCSVTES